MSFDMWIIFCVSAFFSAVSPGPSVVHAIRLSGTRGFKMATASIAGNTLAIIAICTIASVGLSFIKNSTAFHVLRIVGAAYLIYVGIKIFFDDDKNDIVELKSQKSYFKIFTEAVLISITNPKIFIFIAAFFPQFLTPGGDAALQLSIMALTFAFFTSTTLVAYSTVSAFMYKKKSVRTIINRGSGIALVLFGAYTLY